MSPASADAAGSPTSYAASMAVDGVTATAWRCNGDGVGQQLVISFDRAVTLTRIGLIPGLAKTDPGDGTDRYAQNRRISSARYTFDNGKTVDQKFDVAGSNRSTQFVAFDSIDTATVTVTILDSVPGSAQSQYDASNTVAISEISFS